MKSNPQQRTKNAEKDSYSYYTSKGKRKKW